MTKKVFLLLILLLVSLVILINLVSIRNEIYKDSVFRLQYEMGNVVLSIRQFEAQDNAENLIKLMTNLGSLESSYSNWFYGTRIYPIDHTINHNMLKIQEQIYKTRKEILDGIDLSDKQSQYTNNEDVIKRAVRKLEKIGSLLRYENLKNPAEIRKSFNTDNIDKIILDKE